MLAEKKIPLSFPNEEEIYSVFLIEDLIKEYNHKILQDSGTTQNKKVPLSLSSSHVKSNQTFIRAMTKEEFQRIRYEEFKGNDWRLLENLFKDQISPKGLISNVPNIAAGVQIIEIINELGLKGQVYYKEIGNKTYAILKGHPGLRNVLKGTRYLNTHPEIVQLGLAKVTVKAAAKSGFKVSFMVYGAMKSIDAIQMILEEGALKPRFFGEVAADLPKLTISTLIGAAAGGVVAITTLPAAAGVAIVLGVSVTAGIFLEYVDQKTGFTQKLSEAADTMWTDMKEWWNGSSGHKRDPLAGLIQNKGNFVYKQQISKSGDPIVYTA